MNFEDLTKEERKRAALELGAVMALFFIASFAPWPF